MFLSDKQTTTLTLRNLFHFPELLSVEEDPNDRGVNILWTDNVIDDIIHPTIFLHADPDIYDGPWGISSGASVSPSPASTPLIRHFNEHPEDRPPLARRGAWTSSTTSCRGPAALTTPQGRRPCTKKRILVILIVAVLGPRSSSTRCCR